MSQKVFWEYIVKYGKCLSDLKYCPYGVLQGSRVSPVLFLTYINDIAECLDCAKYRLYANDINIFVDPKTFSDLYNLGNKAVALYNE